MMKAAIYLDVPEWQIGHEAQVYFPDTMLLRGKCEAVKIRQRPEKLLPCKCGCKRREHWWSTDPDCQKILKCMKCGFTVGGKNEFDVHQKWNEAIRDESRGD
jgi:hypothetical protein